MDKSSQHFWWLRKISRMGGMIFSLSCFFLHLPPVTLTSSSISLDHLSSLQLYLLSPPSTLTAGPASLSPGSLGSGSRQDLYDRKGRDKPVSWHKRPGTMALCSCCKGGRGSDGNFFHSNRRLCKFGHMPAAGTYDLSLFPLAVISFTCIYSILQMSVM